MPRPRQQTQVADKNVIDIYRIINPKSVQEEKYDHHLVPEDTNNLTKQTSLIETIFRESLPQTSETFAYGSPGVSINQSPPKKKE